ncbi:chondroitinase-B domain-containing protein [Peredibacter starrii]|uniref:Chondroitinase-B domain-containing protein n=1 Tax=Peredibacter starrii TaxID=28202 RepID=A0AAX4HV01_9BACT|nr:chondroitinase-B domain-containing protein [Peredibacter starrii]WPU67076.1 chondroitinase-B domain-containing protein [Peredibacter starrii]
MKLLLKLGLAALLLPIGPALAEVLYKEASQHSGLVPSMVIQTASNSPTGHRVHTTLANTGEALFEFELDEPGKFEVEALLYADAIYRNSMAVSVNGGAVGEWELDIDNTAYQWRKFPQEFQGQAGIQQVRLLGRETYVRIAAVRINKIIEVPVEKLEVHASEAVLTPPMNLTADSTGDYLSSTTNHQGQADFTFLLLEDSQVRLDLLAQGLTSASDSFWLKHADGTQEAIHLGASADFKWKLGPTLNLLAGSHTISIVGREALARLRTLKLTKLGAIPDPEPQPDPIIPAAPAPSRFESATNLTEINALSFSDAATKALAAAPNSKIILPSGTFSNVNVTLRGEGIQNAPIIIEGQPDGSTILTGKILLTVKGSYVLVKNLNVQNYDSFSYGSYGIVVFDDCAYCGLQNSRFDTSVAAVMDLEYKNDAKHFKTIRIKPNSQNVEISNNTFKNKQNAGSSVLVDRELNRANLHEGHRIFRNLFLDRKLEKNDANDFDSIRIGDSDRSHSPSQEDAEALMTGENATLVGTTVEFNVFEGTRLTDSAYNSCVSAGNWSAKVCKGEPEIISIKAPQTIVRFNTFRNNSGGLTIRHGYMSIVEGNYFSGVNLPQGISTIMPNSYGIRIIHQNHLVLNNHIEELITTSKLHGGISILPGNTTTVKKEYWKVIDTIVSGNFIRNVSPRPISLASDYGGDGKTLLPEGIVLTHNVVSLCSVAVVNQAPDEAYLATFSSYENYFDCLSWGVGLVGSVQIPLAPTILNNGFNLPNDPGIIGATGVLYNSASKHAGRLSALSTLSGIQAASRMEKLSQFLMIKKGSLYDNYLPQNRNEVGSSF